MTKRLNHIEPVVIVGAGPAGLVLAYLLVRNGIRVRVFERQRDFDREFRGEFLQPSAIEALDELGILDPLTRSGNVLPITAVRMHFRTKVVSEAVADSTGAAGFVVPQQSLLSCLQERCSPFDHYSLETNANVVDFLQSAGRVAGVQIKKRDSREDIAARFVVVCNGRMSELRSNLGLSAQSLELPYTILWHRFDMSRRPSLVPTTLEGYVGERGLCVMFPTHGTKLQLMWRRRPEYVLDSGASVEIQRSELLRDVPEHWHPIVADATERETARRALRVVTDRLSRWWAPGVLFIGDAAHSMSPIGGLGLTVAVRDAIVAANHIVRSILATGDIDHEVSARIEAERLPEIEQAQLFQTRAARLHIGSPFVQWTTAKLVLPLMKRIRGESYMRDLQRGWTRVHVECLPRTGGLPTVEVSAAEPL